MICRSSRKFFHLRARSQRVKTIHNHGAEFFLFRCATGPSHLSSSDPGSYWSLYLNAPVDRLPGASDAHALAIQGPCALIDSYTDIKVSFRTSIFCCASE
ncbi:hypothetical protein J3458_000744 [Metarhizium acridum]|uniref:uncharacterized protein n=1 Tax=Metarhizium acridum TaxID=92637 RepID=UPI001C6BC4F9|nr:hypothetical protein J3458_000744 [Metarhizium acridum]